MPIYEYHCDACDMEFEEWHRHADDIVEVLCPACKKTAHRVISNTTFVLKGSGWYVTEYGNRKTGAPTPPGATSADKPAATSETTPSSEAETKTEKSLVTPPAAKAETATAAAS